MKNPKTAIFLYKLISSLSTAVKALIHGIFINPKISYGK